MGPKRRGRPKKVIAGGSRRDAAFDAMRPYGFEDEMIGTTLDELLEVYDEAWLFIEDCSYHVLREALLAKSDPTTEAGNQIEAVTETGVGAIETGNVRALTIQSSVGNAGAQEEQVVEEEGDGGTEALKHVPVGEASVVQSNHAMIGDLVVSTEADDGCPIGYLTDTGAAKPSIMILPSPELTGSCEDGSNEVSVEHLSVVPISKDNDSNPFGDGVELHHDKPSESSDEHVPDSKPANRGKLSGSKDMDLREGDQNGSVHPISSSQCPPEPLRRRRRRERKPCYGWLSDDESDEEDYKEHHILQLEPAPLQQSPQRKRIQLEQSKIVSTRSDGGCPVGHIIMDTSVVVPSGLILQDSNASSSTKLFSFGGVKPQCNKSPKPLSREEFANPLLAEDGASSGSQDMDLEENDCFVSKRPISTGQPPLSTILRLH